MLSLLWHASDTQRGYAPLDLQHISGMNPVACTHGAQTFVRPDASIDTMLTTLAMRQNTPHVYKSRHVQRAHNVCVCVCAMQSAITALL